MVLLRRLLVLVVALVAQPTVVLAEPLTNLGKPTGYCRYECSDESLILAAQFDRLLDQCGAGNAEACFTVSTMRMGSPYCCAPSREIDRVWALRTMKKACDLGHDQACWQFYVVLTPWMDNLAKDNAERGCAAGLGYACHVLGSWPLLDDSWVEETALQRLACDLGDPNGCALSYVNVASGAEEIEGATPEEAREKLKYSCNVFLSPKWQRLRKKDMGDMVDHFGCLWLADGLKMGWGGPTNWSKARWLDHYVCRESRACMQLFPFREFGLAAMVGEATVLGLGLVLWRWPRSRTCLEKKLPSTRSRWVRHLGTAIAALLVLQLAYSAWGSLAWLS